MEYVYSAMVLHAAKKPVTEDGVTSVLKAAGVGVDAARVKALNFAVNTKIANKVTIKLMLAKANAQMLSLASKVPAALDDDLRGALTNVPKPPEDKGDKGKVAKEEKKVSEDEAAAGLGALFG